MQFLFFRPHTPQEREWRYTELKNRSGNKNKPDIAISFDYLAPAGLKVVNK
jgi:hypothetical protein